jgi:hypothetical protein
VNERERRIGRRDVTRGLSGGLNRRASLPWRVPRARAPLPVLATLAAGAVLAACAPGRAAGPAPAGVVTPGTERAPVEVESDSGTARSDSAAAADSAGRSTTIRELAERAAAERETARAERPILPFGTVWSPSPVEGSAFGIRLLQRPSGREPVSVEGRFVDHRVPFAPLGGVWFGIAPVPIGTSGDQRLVLDIRFADGESLEQDVDFTVRSRTFTTSRLRVAPKYSSPPAGELDRIRAERDRIRSLLETDTPQWLIDGPFRAPRPLRVTSPFGTARVFNGELRSRHTGLDLKGARGEPVRASARGRVVLTGELYYSGNAVYLDHGNGVYTGYFHLSKILVHEGETVEAGQLIGEVGATGRVTGPHLHWSLYVAGESLDASSLLEIEVPGGAS